MKLTIQHILRWGVVALAITLLAACGSKISQENYSKIQDGMSEREVQAILGETAESSSFGIGAISGRSSIWRDEKTGANISIKFVNGTVKIKGFSKG